MLRWTPKSGQQLFASMCTGVRVLRVQTAVWEAVSRRWMTDIMDWKVQSYNPICLVRICQDTF